MTSYPTDRFNGEERERWVISSPEVLTDTHQGGIHVQSGGSLDLRGILQGSLSVEAGGSAQISGRLQGSLNVEKGVTVEVTGRIEGSLNIDGKVVVEESARVAGSINNEGVLVLSGEQGGPMIGNGEFDIRPEARIKKPDRWDGDTPVYVWND